MTEAEAKTKWCPMVHARHFSIHELREVNRCIGSACMMWRFDQGRPTIKSEPPNEKGEPMVSVYFDRPGNGYCGLAGK